MCEKFMLLNDLFGNNLKNRSVVVTEKFSKKRKYVLQCPMIDIEDDVVMLHDLKDNKIYTNRVGTCFLSESVKDILILINGVNTYECRLCFDDGFISILNTKTSQSV